MSQWDQLAKRVAVAAEHRWVDVAQWFVERCESEIEKVFGMALVGVLMSSQLERKYDQVAVFNDVFSWPDCLPEDGVFAYTQATVGPYRADFLVIVRREDRPPVFIVIECDGRAFHDATAKQADRDRARDRWMVARGIVVLRFSGSEVWRDPIKCADEVEAQIVLALGPSRQRA
jgi:very-short-patch-repair endonuclease